MVGVGARPRLPYEQIDRTEIADIRLILRADLWSTEASERIESVLDRIERRGSDIFGLVVFTLDDLAGLVASRNGLSSWFPGDVCSLEDAELSQAEAARLIQMADERMRDAMAEAGWRILREVVEEALQAEAPQ